jgi:hypothetical protein
MPFFVGGLARLATYAVGCQNETFHDFLEYCHFSIACKKPESRLYSLLREPYGAIKQESLGERP